MPDIRRPEIFTSFPARRISGIAVVSVLAAVLSACVSVRGNETLAWDEEVVLRSGERLSVHRAVTMWPRWEPVKGQYMGGGIKENTIAFDMNRRRVEWIGDDSDTPYILEIVNGEPVVVIPVNTWGPCYKYAFPQEGLVALRFRGGQWSRMPIAELPKDMKVNLLGGSTAFSTSTTGRQLIRRQEQRLEAIASSPMQGAVLDALSRYHSQLEGACVRIKPPPNPEWNEAGERNRHAEQNAALIQAEVISRTTTPETVTPDMRLAPSSSCKGVVDQFRVLEEWVPNPIGHETRRVGYELLVRTPTGGTQKIQIPDASNATMHSVVCSQKSIFAIRRRDKANLIIHAFRQDGGLIGAYRVALTAESDFWYGYFSWPEIWAVADDQGALAITVAQLSYATNGVFTIKQKAIFKAKMPPARSSS